MPRSFKTILGGRYLTEEVRGSMGEHSPSKVAGFQDSTT